VYCVVHINNIDPSSVCDYDNTVQVSCSPLVQINTVSFLAVLNNGQGVFDAKLVTSTIHRFATATKLVETNNHWFFFVGFLTDTFINSLKGMIQFITHHESDGETRGKRLQTRGAHHVATGLTTPLVHTSIDTHGKFFAAAVLGDDCTRIFAVLQVF